MNRMIENRWLFINFKFSIIACIKQDKMKEEILDIDLTTNSNFKLYSQRAIVTTTFLLGPIATGFLFRRNFLNLKEPKKASIALMIGFLSMFLVLLLIFMLPSEILDRLPNIMIPLIYTGLAQLIVEKQMGETLRIHKLNNGEFYPIWKIIVISLSIIIGFGVLAFLLGDFMATRL